MSLILIIGLEVWRGFLFAGLFVWAVEAGGGSCGIVVFEGGGGPRTKRTEILYIFLLGIHTANVVQLENRMEQRERLAAA